MLAALAGCGAPDELSRVDALEFADARERLDDAMDTEETLRTSPARGPQDARGGAADRGPGSFETKILDEFGLAALGELQQVVPSLVETDSDGVPKSLDRPALRAFLRYAETDPDRALLGPARTRSARSSGPWRTPTPTARRACHAERRGDQGQTVDEYLRDAERDLRPIWPTAGGPPEQHSLKRMRDPGHVAAGTWSGGRFMHFGEAIDDERLEALLRPGDGIDTVITADTYGQGEADRLLGRALEGVRASEFCAVGAMGHDFHAASARGRGLPPLHRPALRGPDGYAGYLRMATEQSLERCGVDRFDVLLLHNPDRTGYTSEAVWDGMAALRDEGLAGAIGVAPGPANGFTLDVIDCLQRFGATDRLGDADPRSTRALAGRAATAGGRRARACA